MKSNKFIIATTLIAIGYMGCNEDDLKPKGISTANYDTTSTLSESSDFKIPTYSDNYADISGFASKDQWNLANVHDPSVAYYQGYYYMFGTDASYGNAHEDATIGKHFQGKRSRNLVDWEWIPGPFNTVPYWVADTIKAERKRRGFTNDVEITNFSYWAPCIRVVNVGGVEKIRMYYSIPVNHYLATGGEEYDGSANTSAVIGVCETTNPAGGPSQWEDKGYITRSSSDKNKSDIAFAKDDYEHTYAYYNAIDPTYYVTGGATDYLIHGSWHSGFALLEIDHESGLTKNVLGEPWTNAANGSSDVDDLTSRYGKRIYTRNASSRWQAAEAPEIVYNDKDGYYYLFMAYDGLDVPYNTRVCRSKSIEGPFEDINGTDVTNAGGDCFPIVTHPYKFKNSVGWVGISHCCIFKNEQTGDWMYMSQARPPAGSWGNTNANALMMGHVRKIFWCPVSTLDKENLWPIASPERFANVPQSKVSRSEIVGTWEHINLGYSYNTMDKSSKITLKEDGTVEGSKAPATTWSFDEETGYLTFGTRIVVVQRGLDWEADPRAVTLVYAGIGAKNQTYWGKKVE